MPLGIEKPSFVASLVDSFTYKYLLRNDCVPGPALHAGSTVVENMNTALVHKFAAELALSDPHKEMCNYSSFKWREIEDTRQHQRMFYFIQHMPLRSLLLATLVGKYYTGPTFQMGKLKHREGKAVLLTQL